MKHNQCKQHYTYKIINNLNGMYYIGVHSIKGDEDKYFGSGSALKAAIRKHGKDSFTKGVIEYYDTREEALKAERLLVANHDDKSYNLVKGGGGITGLNYEKRRSFIEEFELFYYPLPQPEIEVLPNWRSETERYIFEINTTEIRKRDQDIRKWHIRNNAHPLTLKIFDCITSESIYKSLAAAMSSMYNDLNKESLFKQYIKSLFYDYGMIEFCSIKVVTINQYNEYCAKNQTDD